MSRRTETAVAVAEQDRDGVALGIRRGDIRSTVPIEIGDHERHRLVLGRVGRRRREAAVAVAEEYGDRVAISVGGHEVDRPVPIQVGGGDGNRLVPGRVIDGRFERGGREGGARSKRHGQAGRSGGAQAQTVSSHLSALHGDPSNTHPTYFIYSK